MVKVNKSWVCLVLIMFFAGNIYASDKQESKTQATPSAEAIAAQLEKIKSLRKEPTEFTRKHNQKIARYLNIENKHDYENALKGFITKFPEDKIVGENGVVAYDLNAFDFLGKPGEKAAPDSVNPSLWRQSQLNALTGLFEVEKDKIYQVRGMDLANITFIRGKTGWIVVDTCTVEETARAAYELVKKEVADLPVKAIILTHSHVDHFGGVKAFATQEQVDKGEIQLIAPEHFFEESISENLMAGNAMNRRATYMYGLLLPRDEKGTVGSGLGTLTATGNVTILEPNKEIKKDGEQLTIDGLNFEFLMASGTEAPSEMMFYIDEYKAFCPAEVVTNTLHNPSTLRGAKTRDGLKWAKTIYKAERKWGDKAEVMFSPHHWPNWGHENISQMLKKNGDTYKYIHDQALRLANMGYTPDEISEQIQLPDALGKEFYNRGYYGTVSHDVRAVYDMYFGAWWDGTPANLHKLPPSVSAKKYVDYMGGEKSIVDKARKSYEQGEYRWVAEVVTRVVYANPKNQEARNLAADAMEQLGYQAESGPWRAYYLTGAQELRAGTPDLGDFGKIASPDMINALPIPTFLDFLAVMVNPEKAEGKDLSVNFVFSDNNEVYNLELSNSVLKFFEEKNDKADATITMKRSDFSKLLLKQIKVEAAKKDGIINIDNPNKARELFSVFEGFDMWFGIIEPNPMNIKK